MIQSQTILKISDNSGAKTGRCIRVLRGFQRRYAGRGDVIILAVQKIRKKNKKFSKVKKGDVVKAVIVRTKSKEKKRDGFTVSFKENVVVLVNAQNKPIGTRIKGPVSQEVKKNKFMKLASLSSGFL
jgi:large subunit ribosomal protein L14